ncbi:MAG: hypothetical protein ABFS56_01680 [Pseudomonadota bacterium]
MKRLKTNFILMIILLFWLEVGQTVDLENGEDISQQPLSPSGLRGL